MPRKPKTHSRTEPLALKATSSTGPSRALNSLTLIRPVYIQPTGCA